MRKEMVWYTCDYCGMDLSQTKLVDNEGYGGIRDEECYCSSETIDICDKPECYKNHLKMISERMINDNGLLLYPLDILIDEVGADYEMLDNNKIKVKWHEKDKWHAYQRNTLIKLIIPYYEKYAIIGNGK